MKKRFLFWFFLLLFIPAVYAADTKITELTADTSPSTDDLITTVNDPGGTPANRKVTVANLKAAIFASPTLTGSLDLGALDSFEFPNAADPTTNAFGECAGDNDAWGASRGAIRCYDGTANTNLVGVLTADTCSNGEVPKWNTGGTWTCEADNNTAGITGTDTRVLFIDGTTPSEDADLTFNKTTNALTAGSFISAANTNPTVSFKDSDAADGDVNASIDTQCTDTGSGTEDCDVTLKQQIAGTLTAFLTADADGSIAVERFTSTTAGNITSTGVIDLGGATSFEFPNANSPTTDAEGECAWDANDNAVECYDGAVSRLIPTLYSLHKTIMDPDGVQAVEDAIPLMEVTADWAPFGITIKDIELSADAANTGAYTIEEWTDPTTASSDVETLTFSSGTEIADDGTLTDASIAAGSFVMLDLSNTALNFLGVTITYYINEGN